MSCGLLEMLSQVNSFMTLVDLTKKEIWLTLHSRRDRCYCCGPAEHGICQVGIAAARVWSLFFVHGSLDLLVLRNLERHHHRGKFLLSSSLICKLLTAPQPVAVMSTVTGNVITKALKSVPEYKDHPEIIASALAVIAGGIVTAIGLLRLGWIVDFISLTAISAFMTGAAITIAVGQVPALLGLKGFSNRNAAYRVTIDSLKHLPNTTLDAAIGLTALLMLYLIRWACNRAAKRNPDRKKTFFFVATLRSAFVMLLYILIGWAVNRHHRDKPSFKILGKVPRGELVQILELYRIQRGLLTDFCRLPARRSANSHP